MLYKEATKNGMENVYSNATTNINKECNNMIRMLSNSIHCAIATIDDVAVVIDVARIIGF